MNTALGDHLRDWRRRRRMSQLDLALAADISSRHLSFIETGRSQPSRETVAALAEGLDMPLRERNHLLTSAGFAPLYRQRPIEDPSLDQARAAIDIILKAHEPLPALCVDRHWNLVAKNAGIAPFLEGVDPDLLKPPVNVLRLSLHPKGLAPRIVNLAEWRAHILMRLARQIEASGDPVLIDLVQELSAYRAPRVQESAHREPVLFTPLQLRTPAGILSFISTTTLFGTAHEVTLSELVIEAFLPADAETARALATV